MSGPASPPTYLDLMLPTLQAVEDLGGSGSAKEIRDRVIEVLQPTEQELAQTYEKRPKSILIDRMDWARSYLKLGGALESPKRGLFLITPLGRAIAALPAADARQRLGELDSDVRARRRARTGADDDEEVEEALPPDPEGADVEVADWRDQLLERLHRLSPAAFEEFVMYLLRAYGLELTRVGGTGDEGIDGIGTAPLSPVLSATVAVQAKRYDPSTAVARDKVALFQRDAAAAGAERAVMVTLGRYTEPARKAATTATPTVDLIDGERLCELVRDQGLGVRLVPSIDGGWFDRFED